MKVTICVWGLEFRVWDNKNMFVPIDLCWLRKHFQGGVFIVSFRGQHIQ